MRSPDLKMKHTSIRGRIYIRLKKRFRAKSALITLTYGLDVQGECYRLKSPRQLEECTDLPKSLPRPLL